MFAHIVNQRAGYGRPTRAPLGVAALCLVAAASAVTIGARAESLMNDPAAAPPVHHGAAPAATSLGAPGDGMPDFRYDPTTGDVTFLRDAFDATKHIRTLVLLSSSQDFITGVGLASQNLSGFDIDQIDQQSIARFGGNGITQATLDLGDILPAGLSTPFLLSDLSVFFNYDGSGATDSNGVPADVIAPASVASPLPSTALGGLALLGTFGVVRITRRARRGGDNLVAQS
jgi:hypothetical protein